MNVIQKILIYACIFVTSFLFLNETTYANDNPTPWERSLLYQGQNVITTGYTALFDGSVNSTMRFRYSEAKTIEINEIEFNRIQIYFSSKNAGSVPSVILELIDNENNVIDTIRFQLAQAQSVPYLYSWSTTTNRNANIIRLTVGCGIGSHTCGNQYVNIGEIGLFLIEPLDKINLSLASLNSNSFKIQWNKDDKAIKYEIYLDNELYTTVTNQNQYTFNDLEFETEYSVFVRGISEDNYIEKSNTLTVTTGELPPKEELFLKSSNIFHDSLKLSWNNTNVSNYEIYQNGEKIGETSRTFYDVKNLEFETEYTFTVRYIDQFGRLVISNPLTITTAELPAEQPITARITDIKHDSLRILWTLRKTSNYEVYQNGEKIADTNSSFYTVRNLNSDTEYTFFVSYIDEFGRRVNSETITVITASEPPPPAPREPRPPPPQVSESDNEKLNLANDELVRGANDQFNAFMMLIPIIIAIIIFVFGVAWLMKIFKKKMNKAKTTSTSSFSTNRRGVNVSQNPNIKRDTRIRAINSVSRNNSRLHYNNFSRNNSNQTKLRRIYQYENFQKRF